MPTPCPDSLSEITPAPTPADSLSEMPSFEEHMASLQRDPIPTPTSKITPDAKERIIQAAIYRDEASRRRLDFAAEKNLTIEEQNGILDKEIALEEADKKLVEGLAADDETAYSIHQKLEGSIDAVKKAINKPDDSTTESAKEKPVDRDDEAFKKATEDFGF